MTKEITTRKTLIRILQRWIISITQRTFTTKIYCQRKIQFFDWLKKKNFKIMTPLSFYDEAFTHDNKDKICIFTQEWSLSCKIKSK